MNDTFLRACRCEPTDYTPVWLMRQAGRYMKEYMEIRKRHSFLEMCRTPEIACEVTLQPVDKLNVDAAIIFADILLPLEGMGIKLEFAKNEGPVILNPVRGEKDVAALRVIEPAEDVPYLLEAIRLVKRELEDRIPLIGFSAAPFTLASYIIEGGGSKNYLHAKRLMYGEPELWRRLMDSITSTLIAYVNAQIDAGADAIQIFDSWAGALSPQDYALYVQPHTRRLIEGISGRVPVINFSTGTSAYIDTISQCGGDVVGVDWRIRLDTAWKRIGHGRAIQGNLDPTVLFAPRTEIKRQVETILNMADRRAGHIFNLGHGIIVGTPVDNVKALVDYVHELSAKNR
ncbi:MAG TPA: uroporphyrinogen decarboxylase [Deltaproteobacteria bacterium]|nr:uroporphyrinogen decarboxylase [Deltaproteobacteria bacterium]